MQWFERRQSALASSQTTDVEKFTYRCTLCRRDYSTSKAYENHLQSKSHTLKASSLGADEPPQVVKREIQRKVHEPPTKQEVEESSDEGEWEEVDPNEIDDEVSASLVAAENDERAENMDVDGEWEELEEGEWDVARCFFCDRRDSDWSMADCMAHMHKEHGFFLPDIDFLVKPEEMLHYLALKVFWVSLFFKPNFSFPEFISHLHSFLCRLIFSGDKGPNLPVLRRIFQRLRQPGSPSPAHDCQESL